MARKDEILSSFLEHPLIQTRYNISPEQLPDTFREALRSSEPIVRAIALIVENLEAQPPVPDNTLRTIITQYLNEATI